MWGEGLVVVPDGAMECGQFLQGIPYFVGRCGFRGVNGLGQKMDRVISMCSANGAGYIQGAFQAIVFQDPIGEVNGTRALVVDEGEGLDEIDAHLGQFFSDQLVQGAPHSAPMGHHGHAHGRVLCGDFFDQHGAFLFIADKQQALGA